MGIINNAVAASVISKPIQGISIRVDNISKSIEQIYRYYSKCNER